MLCGVISILILFVSACAPANRAVVVERKVTGVKQETDKIGGAVIRIVQQGDTLYAIAFAHGLDARDLAAWNGLPPNNRIQVGQKLRLTKPLNFVVKSNVAKKQVIRKSPVAIDLGTKETGTTSAKGNAKSSNQRPNSDVINKPVPVPKRSVATAWQWPVKGSLIRRFALNRGQQGIDIQGALGQSVIAGAAGEIVYVGNGLKGYGNLIIIKHDDEFLSAYAHNQAVFVKEGAQVKQASVIGSIGTNQRGEPALQFQIRKRGLPVNPLSYLPSKQ